MADNFVTDPGAAGVTFGSDDIGGVHYPITKLTFGALDSQTIASSGTGTDDAGTQRVTLATDIALPAGTNAIGKLSANSGVDIGDVDVTSVIPGVGATNLGKAEDAVHSNGDTGIMALGVRADAPASTAADGDYAPLLMSEEGALWTENLPSEVEPGNSSTSTLLADAVFTGTGVDLLDHQTVTVMIDASHDSATDGMQFQFSSDDSNWDVSLNFTYTAAEGGRIFQFGIYARYFRVVYTNGGTGQTHFRCQTLLHHEPTLTTIHRLVDNSSPDRSAEIVKSAIIAQAAGSGDFVPVQATAAGNFKMSVQEISDGLDIGAGNAGAETQRVSISTDDVNLASINTDAGTIAGAVYAEDAASGDADPGIMILARRTASPADTSGADLDYESLQMDNGRLWTATKFNSLIAHDAPISGATQINVIGARATASVEGISEVAGDDASVITTDLSGVQIVRTAVAAEELVSFYVANTDGAEDAVTGLGAGGATIYNYITSVTISNRHATTNAQVNLLDGSGGSVFWEFPAPATGGTTHNFNPPLKQPTVNTALYVDPSAAVTTIGISIAGYQGQG